MLLLSLPIFAVEWRVNVEIATEDSSAGKLLSSAIKRELRSLKDVEVVDEKGDLSIRLIALKISGGYAIASTITRQPQAATWKPVINTTNLEANFLLGVVTNTPAHVHSSLHICPPAGLKGEAEFIVAEFDTRALEPSRQLVRQFRDLINGPSSRQRNSTTNAPTFDPHKPFSLPPEK